MLRLRTLQLATIVTVLAGARLPAALQQQKQHRIYRFDTAHGEIFFGGTQDAATDKGVFIRNRAGQVRQVFAASEGRVFNFAVAPTGEYVAVTEQVLKVVASAQEATVVEKRMSGDRPVFERTTLKLVSRNGQVVGSVEGVRDFSWSPDGSMLALVVGKYQGRDKEYLISGVFIYGVQARDLKRVADRGHHVTWAQFDGNIYIWETPGVERARVTRYVTMTGVTEPTPYHSIYFSQSGDYYFKPAGISGPEGVYARAGNVRVSEVSGVFSGLAGFQPESWSPDRDLLLLTGGTKAGEAVRLIYDPRRDSARAVRADGLVGWGESHEHVLVASGDQVAQRPLSEVLIK